MNGMRWVYVALLAYVAGFALYWPRAFLVVDEERYVSQAVAFSQGRLAIDGAGIVHPVPDHATLSNYPPGTALLQAPLVGAFGWRAAAVLSVVSLLAATLLTARWLRFAGREPAFALIIPGFLGAALFGRIAMSDLPATAIVALACLLLWRARDSRAASFAVAFLTGASLLFREPPVVMLGVLLLGAALRRQLMLSAAIAGFTAGLLLRLGIQDALFGSPFYVREAAFGFALWSLGHSVPIYAAVLLVMLPGGALVPFFYRGDRRIELVAAAGLYVLIFLLFESNAVKESGLVKGLLHASRYMAPLLPLLAYMAAEAVPRAHRALTQRAAVFARLPALFAVGATIVAFSVHPLAHRQERQAERVVRVFYGHTRAAVPVITNSDATLKYLSPAYGPRLLILRYGLDPDTVAALMRRYGALDIAFLDRSDSEHFRRDAAGNDAFLAALDVRCAMTRRHEEPLEGWARMRVLEVRACP